MNGIHIENIVKTYRKATVPAVNRLSLHIREHEIYGLLGPNGAGKTTTLSMLSGLLRHDEGQFYYQNGDRKTDIAKMREKLGVVPQNIALYPTLTARENLWFFGSMHGVEPGELRRRIDGLLELMGLASVAEKPMRTFSGGMKRRLNLIAGLLHNPEILLLDEPTAGVDVQSRNVILEFLAGLKKQGTTVIYTSHYLDEAERLCDHICIIDQGRSIATGSPKELLAANADCSDLYDIFLKITGKELRD